MANNKTDSLIFRTLAEVILQGYTDQYGNYRSITQEIENNWKPSEYLIKKLENKIDIDKLAESVVKSITDMSDYTRGSLNREIREKVIEKLAEKEIERLQEEVKINN